MLLTNGANVTRTNMCVMLGQIRVFERAWVWQEQQKEEGEERKYKRKLTELYEK